MRTHSFIAAVLFASSAYAQLQAISQPGVNGAVDTVLAKAGAAQAQAESGHQIVQARDVTTSILKLDLANPQDSNVDSTGVVAIAEEVAKGLAPVRMVEGKIPTTKRDLTSEVQDEVTILEEGEIPSFADFVKRASVRGAGAQATDGGVALAGPDSGAADQVVATFDTIAQEMQARGFIGLDGLNPEDTVAGYEGDVTSFAKRALPAVTSYQTILDKLNSVIDMIHDAPVNQSQAEQAYGIIATAICILGDVLEAFSTATLTTTFDNCNLTSSTSATTLPDFGELKSIIDGYLADSSFTTPLSTGTMTPTQVDVVQQLANELGDLLLQYYKGYLQAISVPNTPVKRRSLTVGNYDLNTDEEALAQNAITQVSQKSATLGKRQDIVGSVENFAKGSSLTTNFGSQDAALAAAQQAAANAKCATAGAVTAGQC